MGEDLFVMIVIIIWLLLVNFVFIVLVILFNVSVLFWNLVKFLLIIVIIVFGGGWKEYWRVLINMVYNIVRIMMVWVGIWFYLLCVSGMIF